MNEASETKLDKTSKEEFFAGGQRVQANKGMWLLTPKDRFIDTYYLKMKGEMLKKAMKEEPKKVMKEEPKKKKKKAKTKLSD